VAGRCRTCGRAGRSAARELDEDELIGNWTLVGDELEQLSGRRGATKLGFALLLRFYAVHGRFPYGEIQLRTDHRLDLTGIPSAAPSQVLRWSVIRRSTVPQGDTRRDKAETARQRDKSQLTGRFRM
jgi:hypothetical protein